MFDINYCIQKSKSLIIPIILIILIFISLVIFILIDQGLQILIKELIEIIMTILYFNHLILRIYISHFGF